MSLLSLPHISPEFKAAMETRRSELLSALESDVAAEQEVAREQSSHAVLVVSDDEDLWLPDDDDFYDPDGFFDSPTLVKEPYPSSVLNRFSNSTLEILHEAFHGTGYLSEFLERHGKADEIIVRSVAAFNDANVRCLYISKVFQDVCKAISVPDLSVIPAGTPQHSEVSLILSAAAQIDRSRFATHTEIQEDDDDYMPVWTDSFYDDEDDDNDGWFDKEQERLHMTAALARVITEHPDKIDRIVSYMTERNLAPEELDIEHLVLHLENASPAVAEGIL